jgi:hypothetical protein
VRRRQRCSLLRALRADEQLQQPDPLLLQLALARFGMCPAKTSFFPSASFGAHLWGPGPLPRYTQVLQWKICKSEMCAHPAHSWCCLEQPSGAACELQQRLHRVCVGILMPEDRELVTHSFSGTSAASNVSGRLAQHHA